MNNKYKVYRLGNIKQQITGMCIKSIWLQASKYLRIIHMYKWDENTHRARFEVNLNVGLHSWII